MKSGLALFLPFLLLLGGCASPEVVLQDVIKPPIMLGPIHRIGVVVWPTSNPEVSGIKDESGGQGLSIPPF